MEWIRICKDCKLWICWYGVRLGSKYGTVYNINGNKGLAIELKNGKKFMVGTQKAAELKNRLEKMTVANTKWN